MGKSRSDFSVSMGVILSLGSASAFGAMEEPVYKELEEVVVTAPRNKTDTWSQMWSWLLSNFETAGTIDLPPPSGGGVGGSSSDGDATTDPRTDEPVKKTCDQYARELAPFMTPDPVADLGRSIASDAKVILLGESHPDIRAQLKYPEILADLKTRLGADCVAFESVNIVPFDTSNTQADFCRNLEYYEDASTWDSAAAAAQCMGMKVFSVDARISDPDLYAEMELRNVLMVEKVKALLSSGACKKVVMINGSLHLTKEVPGVLENLPTKLNAEGLKNHSVHIASGTGIRKDQQLVPLECLNLFLGKSSVTTGLENQYFDYYGGHYSDQEKREYLKPNSTFAIFGD